MVIGTGKQDREEKEANKGCVKLVSTAVKFNWETGWTCTSGLSHPAREEAGVHLVRPVMLRDKCTEGCLTLETDTANAGEPRA